MVNRVRALVNKVGIMQEQMGNISRYRNFKEESKIMQKRKNIVIERKNAFGALSSGLDMYEEKNL